MVIIPPINICCYFLIINITKFFFSFASFLYSDWEENSSICFSLSRCFWNEDVILARFRFKHNMKPIIFILLIELFLSNCRGLGPGPPPPYQIKECSSAFYKMANYYVKLMHILQYTLNHLQITYKTEYNVNALYIVVNAMKIMHINSCQYGKFRICFLELSEVFSF